ncbi:hypothetical protein APR50_27960 [Variovorax paradoxus]|jgi:hypothetical protein|uniref:UvrD-like helicase C-terminal domain-containing protein n=1 Tax=Hydrogenophaga electricum TaxID=1230953 RepID=A0ABQ6C6R8_9BURK|nr:MULTISPECIES: hypothetical protein [Comamonadaceae]KPV02278.1 hypothetical protein APR50_27960 [Variovorax paradoxus]KPV07492.1 hypothetical protein APR49_17670 [Variovorax paradoxus]KPV18526.1 hypothetical protein APR47_41495 [Variovorax paradoxus]KPV26263.1 hypothetical protein APR48_31575 [Variovorax paradoxus]MBV5294307.1 hypothetical protein [Curvibacter lanceolatus]
MTLHKSKGLERRTVNFVDLGDSAWRSYAQNTAEATAGFFVAFACQTAGGFTNSPECGGRSIALLYPLLAFAGVQTHSVT